MYGHSLNREINHFCRYCLQAFITEEISKLHIKDDEYVKFENSEKKSRFMIYVDFEIILVLIDNGKKNPNESYTNKYQRLVTFSFSYKLVCVDENFSIPFKSYLGERAQS